MRLTAIFSILVMGLALHADASLVTSFNKTTNDGVFTISTEEAAALGVPTADRVGFFRVREGSGTTFNAGDTFDVSTMENSVTSNLGSVLGWFNGISPSLGYDGSTYDLLGTTVLGTSNSYYRGVMFAFKSDAGNIVFKGTSTFNAGQTQGNFSDSGLPPIVPVPEASSLCVWGSMLLLGGIFARRRLTQTAK